MNPCSRMLASVIGGPGRCLVHSMTSSARASKVGGIMIPSVFAAFKINHQLKSRGALNREVPRVSLRLVCGPCRGRIGETCQEIWPIGDETTSVHVRLVKEHGREPGVNRKISYLRPISEGERVRQHDDGRGLPSLRQLKRMA